jgi:hypothetical protein
VRGERAARVQHQLALLLTHEIGNALGR